MAEYKKYSSIQKQTNNISSWKHEYKRFGDVQLYYCNNCKKRFTPGITKNKTFPLRLILDSITYYNRLNTLDESAKKVSEKYGITINKQNISNWLKEFGKYLSFL